MADSSNPTGSAAAPARDRPMRDRPDFQVLSEIGIIAQLVQKRMERRLPGGMTQAQFGVLNHFVRLAAPSSPAKLADAFEVARGAMTHTLGLLEGKGHVAIANDPADGRRKIVTLTEAGRAAHAEALAVLRPDIAAMRDALTEDEFRAALPFLAALRRWLDENR